MRLTSDIAVLLIPLLPLLAALAGYGLRSLAPRTTAWISCTALLLSALFSGQLLWLHQGARFSIPWLTIPDAEIFAGSQGQVAGLAIPFQLDANTAHLLVLLTTSLIAAAVLAFAIREREADPRARQFFATLTLFAGSMLLFVSADTLLVLYLAWELMGVCSYLLIAHPGTTEARRAARQAFWTTRATDTGLLFAVLLTLMRFKWTTISSIDISAMLSTLQQQELSSAPYLALLSIIAVLLLLACIGKAAQLPLSFWLPDAMVAPAPVSALLHAATMVAAGPFLLISLRQIIDTSEVALLLCVLFGGLTLLLGGVMALCSSEPKRVLAYSTVSQLGLVILSVGALAEEVGLYHLVAHAWFKAALFLAVGYVVIIAAASQRGSRANGHSHSLHELSGAVSNPVVKWTLLLAGLSLAGAWPLAGALGKEQVLHALLHRAASEPQPGYVLGQSMHLAAVGWSIGAVLFLLAVPITAAYITRLAGMLCYGKPHGSSATAAAAPVVQQADEPRGGWQLASWLMLAMAGIGSVGWAAAYMLFRANMSGETTAWKWGNTLTIAGILELLLSQALVWAGILVAWQMNVRQPASAAQARLSSFDRLARFFRDGMYLREAFTLAIWKTGALFAMLAGRTETNIIDWLAMRCGALGRLLAALARWVDDYIVDGLRRAMCAACWRLKRLHAHLMQTGQIQHYMFIILLATVLLCFAALGPLSKRLADILGSK